MKEIIIEIFRTIIVPLTIGLGSMYFGSKINESKNVKNEKVEREKQEELLYLRLQKLSDSLYKRRSLLENAQSLKDEINGIQEGSIEYSTDEFQGLSKSEHLEQLASNLLDINTFSFISNAEEVASSFKKVKLCPYDKLSSKKRLDCLKILETDGNLKLLDGKLTLIEELTIDIKPKYE